MKNKIQLITYADSLGKNLFELEEILDKHFSREIKGVHVLPFYPSSADRGFSPLTHLEIDKSFGNWEQFKKISQKYDLTADLVVNHISSESKEFQDFLSKGEDSEYADFFITNQKFSARINLDKVNKKYKKLFTLLKRSLNTFRKLDFIFHKNGVNKFALKRIYRPRTGSPFEEFLFADGKKRSLWCTFSRDQIDFDIYNLEVKSLIERWIENLAKKGVSLLRLDAVGYCAKKKGTTSFMIPETYKAIEWLADIAHRNGMKVLPEIHNHYRMQLALAKTKGVDYVYDFCLPLLVLHSIFESDSKRLKYWIKIRPQNQITTLDTHDGIGIIDVEGLMTKSEAESLSKKIFENGGNATMRASGTSSKNVDIYQINTTYFSALGGNKRAYLIARAIQFFVPGIPQVYYVGMLAGKNDEKLLKKTGNGRDVNRHYYSMSEVERELKRDVVESLKKLMRFRNDYPAFNGLFELKKSSDKEIILAWRKGKFKCKLFVDFTKKDFVIEYLDHKNDKKRKLRV